MSDLLMFVLSGGGDSVASITWRDILTGLVGVATAWIGISTARTSRKTNRDTLEAQSYMRADQVSGETINRLRQDIKDIREDNERRDRQHEAELAQRDKRIEDLKTDLREEKRARLRLERRTRQLVTAIESSGGTVPPEVPLP